MPSSRKVDAPIGSWDERQVTGERPRRHKYGAVRTEVDGIKFASKREAARYCELKLLQKAGEIKELELQPKFPIRLIARGHDRPVVAFTYVADFRYREGPRGLLVIEDVKGMRNRMYQLKKKCVELQYDIRIREV